MNKKVVVHSTKPTGWSRATSIGSNSSSNSSSSSSDSAIPSPPSSELCALIGFAYRLGSIVRNHDSNIVNNSDVRREAKLLMSLSCSSPDEKGDNDKPTDETMMTSESSSTLSSALSSAVSGRITPTHSVTSISSGGSRRDTFCFTCPSLSLHNTRGTGSTSSSSSSSGSSSTVTPGSMLSRTLKVDDQDAMRLSSEAMARNVIESFQKAMEWRIQSWVDSLSRVLVIKEIELKSVTAGGNKAMLQQELFYSNEALLVTALREIEGKVQVLEATTAFKVLNKVSQVDETGSALKKRRMGGEDRTGLEEGEYVYDVIHVLEMQCSLNISTPAGNVQIDLNVPGKIKGTFFSSEDDSCGDKLTDVSIHLNTDMMASMIEKSSRIAVRASTEALLKGEHVTTDDGIDQVTATKTPQEHCNTTSKTTVAASPLQTRSPKRKGFEANNVSGLVVITPARNTASSPSSFGESCDSDGDNKIVKLQIPNSFSSTKAKRSGKILQPQVSRASSKNTPGNLDFPAHLSPKKYLLHQKTRSTVVVTPLKTTVPKFIKREKGPSLPVLLEVACATIQSKKKK